MLIDSYGIVPDPLLMPVAIGLPLLEVVAAVGLMMDIRGSLTSIGALLLVFMAILGYGIWMGLDVDCGCFGPEDPESRAYHGLRSALYRDFIMLAGVLYLYVWRVYRRKSPYRLSEIILSIRKGDVAMRKGIVWGLVGIGLVLGGYGRGLPRTSSKRNSAGKNQYRARQPDQGRRLQMVGTEELKGWIDAKKDMVIIDTMPYEDSTKRSMFRGPSSFSFPSRK